MPVVCMQRGWLFAVISLQLDMVQLNHQASEEERYDECSRASTGSPCFYKTVSEYSLEGGPACWMQVPPEFVRSYLPHVDQVHTVLQNAEGETWPVVFVAKHGFVTGWAEFATGNALAIGDTLVFSFVEPERKNHFAVQVIAKSGCEKRTQRRKDLAPPTPFRPDHIPKSGQQADVCKSPPRSQANPRNDVVKARALVMKATLRTMNFTPPKQHQQRKKQKLSVGDQTVEAASRYNGERDGSHRWDDTEAAADQRAVAEQGMHFRRDDTNVPPPRKPGRPRKVPPQDPVVTKKRKPGGPRKHQQTPRSSSDLTSQPVGGIFVSRRRKVTQAERELALNSAYQLASQLHASSTFCIIVLRQSSVYRNFVLTVPRPFANRYMPDTNREVALVDSAWNAWFGAFNATHKYIRGGWRNFALEHCLEEDDALVLELLEDHPQVLTLKVHLFPVVPVPPGLTGWHSHVWPQGFSFCSEPPIATTGVPMDPDVLRAVGTLRPRPRRRRGERKRVRSSSHNSEHDFTTWSSDSTHEFD